MTTKIKEIGVSAQQHGTVYLKQNAAGCLANLISSDKYTNALKKIFSKNISPICMDSSTSAEYAEITDFLHDDAWVSHLTSSVATEKFADPQIRKFMKMEPENYQKNAHIAFISSFVTSLFIGCFAPLDVGDGFGINLAYIRKSHWSDKALNLTALSSGPCVKADLETNAPVKFYSILKLWYSIKDVKRRRGLHHVDPQSFSF